MNTMLVSNNLFKKSSKSQKIRCEICANYCKIVDGNFGACKQHKNINGELFNISYGIVSSLSPDPIEKKPLNKFLPGTFTYSIRGFSCNMTCSSEDDNQNESHKDNSPLQDCVFTIH